MTAYIALIRKEARSDYGVDFPDFPGCITAGRSLEEARHMAAEALALHVEGTLEDGATLPAPSSLDAIMSDRRNSDAVAFLVDVPVAPPRAVRVNVTLPADVIEAIDKVTTNRSRFLADAARAKLNEAA
ncbi:MAG: type II toxin-antitoxin system HicB family antitoxin [Acetobacteraceae bacterium]